MALVSGGCKVEKSPPEVQWLSPGASLSVSGGEAVALRFEAIDPFPDRGRTGAAAWRIEIGPASGGTWWSASGNLSQSPVDQAVRDTIETTWHVPQSVPLQGSESEILLKAIVTDGEGQQGADFRSGNWQVLPLESMGLWWAGSTEGDGLSHSPLFSAQPATFTPLPLASDERLVFLDGADLIVTGGSTLRGWHLSATGNATEPTPAWTTDIPPQATQDGMRYLRRAPHEQTLSAWTESGWVDRCLWHDETGLLRMSWVLDQGETLLDGGVIAGHMVVLARTASDELRLIRFNLDSGARLGSVTWTPTAEGSQGPQGRAWLLALDGTAVGLETDGTGRQWNPDAGASSITTISLPGSGEVQSAGRVENGRHWISRSEAHILDASGTTLTSWEGPITDIAWDRAEDILWILTGTSALKRWIAASNDGLAPLGEALPSGPNALGGSVAHNRPGPP